MGSNEDKRGDGTYVLMGAVGLITVVWAAFLVWLAYLWIKGLAL